MPSLLPRQQNILEIARRDGFVDVETLADLFSVTKQTIRKDLNDLCEMDKLDRIHGGAVFPSNTVNLAYQSRREIAAGAKRSIARKMASIVPDGASLILNIGTTTEMVAEELRRHQNLLVITNNLNVAMILYDAADIEVIMSGGSVRKTDGGVVGAAAIDLIRQFKVDYAIIGASAIDEEGALLDFDYREVRVAQAILAQARNRVLVADSTKFERRAPVQIGHLSKMDMLVTDSTPTDDIMELCNSNGVDVVIAPAETTDNKMHAAE